MKDSQNRPLGYIGGDIMTFGSGLAREYEYNKIKEANIPGEIYSPILNKSINDKSNMTEEENNHLAEKIVAADVERLWNSDYTVLCTEQSALGTLSEISILYAWKYMAEKLLDLEQAFIDEHKQEFDKGEKETCLNLINEMHNKLWEEIQRILAKKNYAHYFDIRTNHLNEKDWRRSFSINQFIYGVILAATADRILHNSFDEIIPILQNNFKEKENEF